MPKQVILIHGGDPFNNDQDYLDQLRQTEAKLSYFFPKHDWKTTLDQNLGEGYQVLAPRMPCKDNAHYEHWCIWFEKLLPFLDSEIILVGHSLGAVFLPKYLATHTLASHIKALVLISAPSANTPGLGDFALAEDIQPIADKVDQIHLFHSQDDPVVAYSAVLDYGSAWPGAQIHSFTDRGHFNQNDFPELVELIKSL